MQTVAVLILSMAKQRAEAPWSIKFQLQDNLIVETTIGSGGKTSLNTIGIGLLEKLVPLTTQYPFFYDMQNHPHIENRSANVRFLGNKPVSMDFMVRTASHIENSFAPSNFVGVEESVNFEENSRLFTQMDQENARTVTEVVTSEIAKNENRYWIFMDRASVKVIDGDTIHGYILGYSWPEDENVPEMIGKQEMKNQSKEVAVRYLGIDTFETFGNEDRNSWNARLYGVPWEVLDRAGEESKRYNSGLVFSKQILAISLQYNRKTRTCIYDSSPGQRLMGVVYATSYGTWEEAREAARGNYFKGVNINKELLRPMYSDYQAVLKNYPQSVTVPLAEFTGAKYSKDSDGIDTLIWASELGLRNPPTEPPTKEVGYGASEEQLEATREVTETVKTKMEKPPTREDVSLRGYINNDLAFVPPYDDRLATQQIYRADVLEENALPWDYENRVRIGDVFIPIPPLSIRLDKQYSTEKVTTMRAKSSLQKGVGNVRNVLTLDLYYHDLESINGTEALAYTTEDGQQVHYAMDGLRPLLAQFKKAPFLPIDNRHINEKMGIHNVVLRNLHIETVPGFPEAIKATLIIEEFDAAPYMMGQVALGSQINYPLLRWHYQQLLHRPVTADPWRDYLPKVERLDNRVTFSLINEAELATRQELVREFRGMKTPGEYEEELLDGEGFDEASNEKEREYQDGLRIRKALEQMEAFQKYVKGDIYEKFDKTYAKIPVVIGESFGLDKWNNMFYFSGDAENFYAGLYKQMIPSSTTTGKEIAKAVYGIDPSKQKESKRVIAWSTGKINQFFTTPADGAFYPLRTISSGTGYLGLMLESQGGSLMKESLPFGKDLHEVIIEKNFPGFFQLFLNSKKAKEKLKQLEMKGVNRDEEESTLFLVPAGDLNYGGKETAYLTILKELSTSAKSYDNKVQRYKAKYNALATEINRTEETMKMDNVFIPNLIPMHLQVSLENNFSTVQVQTATTPTMQYFGAQDPEIQFAFETDSNGVQAIEKMLRKVGQYVKQYRDGLVSGFLDISNPTINMLGIQSVLPVSAQYTTIAGHPGRYSVSLVLSAFNKTQRRQEALYGYTAGNPDETLIDRAFDNYDPAIDGMYVHERMRQMELYPDLGMPKISELNAVIKRIGSKMDVWENRTDQVFLDPDFYISTKETYRKYLKDAVDDSRGVITRFHDAAGYEAESSLLERRALNMDGKTDANGVPLETKFNEEISKIKPIDPKTTWSNFHDESEANAGEAEGQTGAATAVAGKAPAAKNKELSAYLSNKQYETGPAHIEWKKWGYGTSKEQYTKWIKAPESTVTDEQVWLYLADCVMTAFGKDEALEFGKYEEKMLTDESYTFDDSATKYYFNDNYLGAQTWADDYEYYAAVYRALEASGAKEELENGLKPAEIGKEITNSTLKNDVFAVRHTKKMKFQRVMSYMRSVMRAESGWRQFENNKPLIQDFNEKGEAFRAGIMGALLTNAKTEAEAKRLIWDWKYNIKQSVNAMAKTYHLCRKSDFKEIHARALDWAIVAHAGIELPAILSSNDAKDDKSTAFMKGAITPDRSLYFRDIMEVRKKETALASKERATGIFLGGSKAIEGIYRLYEQTKTVKVPGGASIEISDEVKDATFQEEQESITLNMESWDVEKKFKSMFTDMYQHDQTGRMLRAFPSFSLQLIDEGKWYNNFRTWDNFYGFNALHSIDVYKSRKIAADTAVIKMSNMYGGLTTKRKDMEYTDLNINSVWSMQFWEQDVFNIPDEEVLADRKEIFKTMMLQTGARVHLRMGYGSDARYLPVVFNGTITEVGTGDELEIVCQGDGLELSNVISGSEKDKNKNMFVIHEPSEYIGRLLTSKGNWIKDFISGTSKGEYFKESPLGIAHFGSSVQSSPGNYVPFSSEHGEAVQNVYSQNGQFTKEQWRNTDNTQISAIEMMFGGLTDGATFSLANLTPPADEDNILVSLYGSTPWDIIQTFALCSKDYVAAVNPFETRSTLFFGKPHWPITYKYDHRFTYDAATKKWSREIIEEHQKTFMQAHIYNSAHNIISNDMIASEEGVYTNVIVSYDGHTVGPMQADNDIRLDKQKTTMVEANIMGRFGTDGSWADIFGKNYYTAEAQAQVYGMSTVRDFMKDMYKGSYTVLGDATTKPYDVCFMSDTVQDMQGVHMVKAVHHSMSLETGFISVIEPDAYVINWDAELLFLSDKIHNVGKNVALRAGMFAAGAALSYAFTGRVMHALFDEAEALVRKFGPRIGQSLVHHSSGIFYEMLGTVAGSDEIVKLAKNMRESGRTAEDVLRIQEMLVSQKNVLKENKQYYKALQEYKSKGTLSPKYADIVQDIMSVQADEMDEYIDVYRGAVRQGNVAQSVATLTKITKATTPILKKTASMVGVVLRSTLFWTVVADLVLEVATSGLLEMWTRSKQNAECVKIVPLTYKGQAWTAGISGHRGSVWGDTPSLSDKVRNAEFGSGDEALEGSVWTWIPMFLNAVSDDNAEMDTTMSQETQE